MRFLAPSALTGRSPRCLKLPTSGDPASAFVARRRWPLRFCACPTRFCRPDRSGRLPRAGRGRMASSSVRLGPFIAALYRAMFQTQTTGPAAAWPGNPGSRRRSWGSIALRSFDPVRRSCAFPRQSTHVPLDLRLPTPPFSRGAGHQELMRVEVYRPGNPPRLLGFPTGNRPVWPGCPGLCLFQVFRRLGPFIAAGRAGRVSSPWPATGLWVPLPVPDARELGRRSCASPALQRMVQASA